MARRHFCSVQTLLLSLDYICRLRAFLAFGDLEFHLITFLQTLVSLRTDRAVMNKYVWSICAPDEPVPFRVIEPLYGSMQTFHLEPLFCTSPVRGLRTCPQSDRMHFGAGGVGCQEDAPKRAK